MHHLARELAEREQVQGRHPKRDQRGASEEAHERQRTRGVEDGARELDVGGRPREPCSRMPESLGKEVQRGRRARHIARQLGLRRRERHEHDRDAEEREMSRAGTKEQRRHLRRAEARGEAERRGDGRATVARPPRLA